MSDGSTAAQYLGNLLYERSHFFISCKRDLFLGNYTTVCPSICMFVQSWLKCLKKYLMYLAKRLKTNDFGNCFFCCWFFLFRNDCYNIGWWLDEQIDWLLYIAIYCYSIYILPLKGLYTTCPIHPLTHKRDFYLEFTWIHTQIMHREELRVQYLAQEYCGMQTGGARNRNNNIPSSSSTSTSGLPPDHRYPSVIHQNLN